MNKDTQFILSGKHTIKLESKAVADLEMRIDERFEQACALLYHCKGRVAVTGIGKSGHIANKIAATLSSTGTPAFFLHPGEASHGDLGMITKDDCLIAISNSGNSSEIVTLLPVIKHLGIPMIAMTGKVNTPISNAAKIHLDISVSCEACPLDLAPTSSTTAALAMGDALAVALLEARGFTCEDFARSHPGGVLGRRLLLKVEDIMRSGKDIPTVQQSDMLPTVLAEMSEKGLGMTTVIDAEGQLTGIFTDGDLRRTVDRNIDISSTQISKVMTRQPQTIHTSTLAVEALRIMESKKITAIVVNNDSNETIGVLHMHDLLRAGLS